MKVLDYLKDRHIQFLLAIILLLVIADIYYGIHLGVEFSGGTEIPVTLQQAVDPSTMSTIIATLQQRTSTFGLKQVSIEGVGNSQVYVTIPSVSPADINATIQIIQQQGIFQGVVNGREALNGTDILGGSSGISPSYQVSGTNVSWVVNFYITQGSAQRFANVVFGQANQPLYMFLDRPTRAIVLVNASLLSSAGSTQSTVLQALQQSLEFGNRTIQVRLISSNLSAWKSTYEFLQQSRSRYATVIIANNTPASIIQNITSLNYTILARSNAQMVPTLGPAANNSAALVVESWPAVGLLSSPILNSGVTTGGINEAYSISGLAQTGSTVTARIASAQNESTTIASVLSGGALPVQVIVGVPFTTPATLGKNFEIISAVALLLAVIAVAITIGIRYKKLFLIAPIIFTTLAELFIIVSIIGVVGTIDLSAVAGMIAVIGTGVDAQIIITDEVLHGGDSVSFKTKLNHAFYVVWADAILLIIAMLPLLFSTSLVTVIGFAESTILGALLGAMITRPAYGAIVSRHFSKGEAK